MNAKRKERSVLEDETGLPLCTEGAEAHLVGAAYVGRPTREKALVFVYAGEEYLVPVTNQWDGARVVESTIYLNRTERVIARPHGTSCMTEMKRCSEISRTAKAALLRGVQSWFLPEKGYKIVIVPFEC